MHDFTKTVTVNYKLTTYPGKTIK